jgi:hypothetical protein
MPGEEALRGSEIWPRRAEEVEIDRVIVVVEDNEVIEPLTLPDLPILLRVLFRFARPFSATPCLRTGIDVFQDYVEFLDERGLVTANRFCSGRHIFLDGVTALSETHFVQTTQRYSHHREQCENVFR